MNATVHTLSPHVMSVDAPAWLKDKPYWLTWAYESDARDPEGTKPRKVPYYTNGQRRSGTQGGASDLAQLTTFEAARAAARRRGFDGVGLALSQGAGIVACDFDNCINVDGHVGIHPAVRDVVLGTYAEYSPSGQGIRAFFKGAALGNFKDAHGKPFGFEIFSDKGFVTFTGNATEDTDMLGCLNHVELVNPELKALCDLRFGVDRARAGVSTGDALMDFQPIVGVSPDEIAKLLAQLNPDMSRDKWIQVGMATHHETAGSLEGFNLWDEWSRGGAKYGLGQPIERVWESFKRDAGRVVTMATVKKMVAQSVGEVELDQAMHAAVAPSPLALRATEFVVDGFLSTGLTVIAGRAGGGKTSNLVAMFAQVAHLCDSAAMLRPILRRHVVYVAEDTNQVERCLYGLLAHGNSGAAPQEFLDWFHIVPSKRVTAEVLASTIQKCHERYSYALPNGFIVEPVIVIDTANATIDLDNENDNSEVGKVVAILTQSVGRMSLCIVAHTPKGLNRTEVENMSPRGASAWVGDANATIYAFEDDALPDARFLALGKRRFEADLSEIMFTSVVHEEHVEAPWGGTQTVRYRVSTPHPSSARVRESAREDARDRLNRGALNRRS